MIGGFRDFNSNEIKLKNQLINELISFGNKLNYNQIENSIVEKISNLEIKSGDNQKLIYKLDDEKGLRFDLTILLMRWLSENRNGIKFPYKIYHYGQVFRGERQQKGRYREFTQFDFDIIGSNSLLCEIELINIINIFLDKNFSNMNYKIHINDKKILYEFYNSLSYKNENLFKIVDKIDKIGIDKVINEIEYIGYSKDDLNKIKEFILFDGNLDDLSNLFNRFNLNIEVLNDVSFILSNLKLSQLKIDLSLVRGLDYYNGIIIEVKPENGNTIIAGGRYDNFLDNFGWKNISTIGISFGIDRLYDLYDKQSNNKNKEIFFLRKEDLCYYKLFGKDYEIFLNYEWNLSKKLDYANKNNYKEVYFIDDNKVYYKNLENGHQQIDLYSTNLINNYV